MSPLKTSSNDLETDPKSTDDVVIENAADDDTAMEVHSADDGQRPCSVLMLLLAVAIRFIHLNFLQKAPFFNFKIGDADRYDQWAQNIAAGDWIGQGVFYQAPLYPYFLGLIHAVLGGDVMTIRKVQIVLGAISCVFLMNAAWNLFGKRAGILAGLLASLYAPSIFYESLIQKSILDLLFLSLIVWLYSKVFISNRNGRPNQFALWGTIGVTTGLLCLSRENALILIPMVTLWIALNQFRAVDVSSFKQRSLFGVAFIVGVSTILLPVAIRNFAVGGEFHLTTSQLGPNFYIGNNPDADGTYQPLRYGRGDAKYEAADAKELAEKALNRELTPKEVSSYWLGQSLAFIQTQPAKWLGLVGKKVLMSVNQAEIIDTIDPISHSEYSPILRIGFYLFNFGLLFPCAILGIWMTRNQFSEMWLLHFMTLGFFATLVAFFVFGRYRFPLVPLMIPFAAVFLDRIWSLYSQPTVRKRTLQIAAAFLFLMAMSWLPIWNSSKSQAITFSNFGGQMLLRGKHEAAEEYFERSLRIMPRNAVVYNNLGVLYREQKEFDKAIECFQKAVEFTDKEHLIAQRNLTQLIADQNQGQEIQPVQ